MTLKPLYNYVLHCTFKDNPRVRVVGACGATVEEAFASIVRLFVDNKDDAVLLHAASQERIDR